MRKIKDFFTNTTTRLAMSYLLVIMAVSLGFTNTLYQLTGKVLEGQLRIPEIVVTDPRGGMPTVRDIDEVIESIKRRQLALTVQVNASVFIIGAIVSYLLARRTLRPIEEMIDTQIQFVSDAAHELRTPLATLQTTNEVTLRTRKNAPQYVKDILQDNIDETVKLRTLTDTLLNLAKIENDIVLTPTPLSDIVNEALAIVADRATTKKITVKHELNEVYVNANQPSLVQALVVILDNAIKYSPENSTVHLTTDAQRRQVYLHIRDEGQGIDPEQIPHIFDRFYKADESRSKQTSTGFGIGLSLAQKIINRHNGKITVTSKLGKGTTFTIRLALA